jgi:hypothetical protein
VRLVLGRGFWPCPRRSSTEQDPQLPAGARMTMRLRVAAERRIRDAGFHRRPGRPGSAPVLADRTHAFRDQAREVADAPLPEADVLGIGETRRGKPRWEQDPDTGRRAGHSIGGIPASSTPSGRAGCWARSGTAASPTCWPGSPPPC